MQAVTTIGLDIAKLVFQSPSPSVPCSGAGENCQLLSGR